MRKSSTSLIPPKQIKGGLDWISMALIIAITACIGVTAINGNLGVGGAGGVLAMAVAVSLPFVLKGEMRRDPFHPYTFLAYKLGVLNFLIPFVALLLFPGSIGGTPIHEIGEASLIVAVFFGIAYIGYQSGIGGMLAKKVPLLVFPKEHLSRNRVRRGAIIVYALAWGARIQQILLGSHHFAKDLGGSLTIVSSVLSPLSNFGTLAFILLIWLRLSRNDRMTGRGWMPVLILVILEMGAGAIAGSRANIIAPLVYAGIVYHKTVRPLSWRMIVVGTLTVLFLIGPLVTAYRVTYKKVVQGQSVQAQLGSESIAAAQSAADLATLGQAFSEERYTSILRSLQRRFSVLADGTLRIADRVPDRTNFKYGGTFLPGAFINLVPRIIWPSKPVHRPGREMAREIWGKQTEVSMAVGFPAELYYNFRWLGVALAGLIGMMINFFYERYTVLRGFEYVSIVRYFFIINVVIGMSHLYYYPAGIIRGILFYYIFMISVCFSLPYVIDK